MVDLEKPKDVEDKPEHLAHYYHGELLIVKRNIKNSYIQMGWILFHIKKHKLYQFHGYDKFAQYMADPYIDIRYSTAMQLIRVYEYYCRVLSIDPDELMGYSLDYYKLDMMRPVVTKKNYKDLLAEAREHPRENLRDRIKELRGQAVPGPEEQTEFVPHLCTEKPECPYSQTYQCPYNKPVEVDHFEPDHTEVENGGN